MNTVPENENLHRSQELATSVLAKGDDAIFIVRRDGVIAYVNDRVGDLLGFSQNDLLGQSFIQLFSAEHLVTASDRLALFFDRSLGFDRYESVLHANGGHMISVELSVFATQYEGDDVQLIMVRDINARKRIEEEILEDADRYRDLFDNATDLIQSVSPDGAILYVNRAWHKTLGYTEEDIKNIKIFDVMCPDDKEHCMQLFGQAINGISLPLVTVIYQSKSGKRVILEGAVSARTVNGKVVSTRGIFRNVTERVSDEKKIRELASIVDRSFESILTTDAEGTITYVNTSWQELNGWSASEVVGKVTPRIVKSGMQDGQFYERIWKYIKAGNIASERVINKRKDGTLYHAEIVIMPLIDENGVITGFAGFQHDVTARDLAEQAMVDAKKYAEDIIDGANAIVVVLDDRGMIEVFNRNAEVVTGYAKADLINKNWFEVLVPRDRYPEVWAMFENALQHGFPKTFENPILTKDGQERIIAWTNSERIQNGKISGVITFGMDITERKRIENELVERNRDLERFKDLMVGRELKMIELKNEITALKGRIEPHE